MRVCWKVALRVDLIRTVASCCATQTVHVLHTRGGVHQWHILPPATYLHMRRGMLAGRGWSRQKGAVVAQDI